MASFVQAQPPGERERTIAASTWHYGSLQRLSVCHPLLTFVQNYCDRQSIVLHEGGSIAWAQSNNRTMAKQGNVRKHIHTARHAVCAHESRERFIRVLLSNSLHLLLSCTIL